MEVPVSSKEINRLLKMKGDSRLGVQDEITEKILEYRLQDTETEPGISLAFLESKRRDVGEGEWFEYNVLYKITKIESAKYLEYAFKGLSKIVNRINAIGTIDSFGIEEVLTLDADSYYVLFYIIKNGRNKEEN